MEISQADASKQQNEQSTDDDTVEGLKGVRLSTVMMLILWAAAIVFRYVRNVSILYYVVYSLIL